MAEYSLSVPLERDAVERLRAGDTVYLTGTLYTARDAAHKRFETLLQGGEPLPVPAGACIYYAGPCPAAPGEVIGPCGPTTSKRMDSFTPALIDYGVTGLIGKGPRSEAVRRALAGRAVYFAATGGAGMLIASCIRSCEPVAFLDLGTEAVYRLTVDRLPVIVAIDAAGGNLSDYEQNKSEEKQHG